MLKSKEVLIKRPSIWTVVKVEDFIFVVLQDRNKQIISEKVLKKLLEYVKQKSVIQNID